MVNTMSLKLALPSAVKWTIVADFLAVAGHALALVPATVFGVPTIGFVTVVGGLIATWEAYAIKQEDSGSPTGSGSTSSSASGSTGSGGSPAPSSATISASLTTGTLNKVVTFIIKGLTPNSQVALYQEGLPDNQTGSLTQLFNLDSTGSATLNYTVTPISPIGTVISAEGSIGVYAVDSTGAETTNSVTLN